MMMKLCDFIIIPKKKFEEASFALSLCDREFIGPVKNLKIGEYRRLISL